MRKRIAKLIRKLADWLDPVTGGNVTIQGGGGGGPKEPK